MSPTVWVHAASVGEALTAVPVISRLRAAIPASPVVLSHSSPTVAEWPSSFSADHSDYIPLDEPGPTADVLRHVRPSLIVFARGDLWPEFVAQAAAAAIPLAVVGGTVRPHSRRLAWPLRPLFRETYRRIAWLGAASRDDAARWQRLGVSEDRIEVTGDPRHDHILEREPDLHRLEALRAWTAHGAPLLLAGSTDATDEAIVLEAFRSVSRFHPEARLVIVPHEPSRERLATVERRAGTLGIGARQWDGQARPDTADRCLVVTSVGVLADLYLLADVAYVGGGFDAAGVHAVAEPAAYSIPVVMGPNYRVSADAERLVQSEAGVVLGASRGAAAEFAEVWQHWIAQPGTRRAVGLRARRTLAAGAATSSARALLELLAAADTR